MDAAIPGALAAEITAAGSFCCFSSAAEDVVILFAAHLLQIMDADVAAAAKHFISKKSWCILHQLSLCIFEAGIIYDNCFYY